MMLYSMNKAELFRTPSISVSLYYIIPHPIMSNLIELKIAVSANKNTLFITFVILKQNQRAFIRYQEFMYI